MLAAVAAIAMSGLSSSPASADSGSPGTDATIRLHGDEVARALVTYVNAYNSDSGSESAPTQLATGSDFLRAQRPKSGQSRAGNLFPQGISTPKQVSTDMERSIRSRRPTVL